MAKASKAMAVVEEDTKEDRGLKPSEGDDNASAYLHSEKERHGLLLNNRRYLAQQKQRSDRREELLSLSQNQANL
jgi:hypothetical protein